MTMSGRPEDEFFDDVEAEEARLEAESVSLAAQRGVLQTRIGFTETMTGLLTDGASNLVLADVNEEAAKMLAIDTRNQLAASALAFVTQSDRSALNLVDRGLERPS